MIPFSFTKIVLGNPHTSNFFDGGLQFISFEQHVQQ